MNTDLKQPEDTSSCLSPKDKYYKFIDIYFDAYLYMVRNNIEEFNLEEIDLLHCVEEKSARLFEAAFKDDKDLDTTLIGLQAEVWKDIRERKIAPYEDILNDVQRYEHREEDPYSFETIEAISAETGMSVGRVLDAIYGQDDLDYYYTSSGIRDFLIELFNNIYPNKPEPAYKPIGPEVPICKSVPVDSSELDNDDDDFGDDFFAPDDDVATT